MNQFQQAPDFDPSRVRKIAFAVIIGLAALILLFKSIIVFPLHTTQTKSHYKSLEMDAV